MTKNCANDSAKSISLPQSQSISFRSRCHALLHPSLFTVVLTLLVVSIFVVPFPLSVAILTRASKRIEKAGADYAALVSEAAGKRVLPFFAYPHNVLLYTDRALASPVRSSINAGGGWLNPDGSINNAAFWLGKYPKRYSGVYYSLLDNVSLNATLVCHQSFFAANESVGPDNVVIMRLNAPNATGWCNGSMTIRPYSDPNIPSAPFRYLQNYDFRHRPHFVQTMALSSDNVKSRTPQWFPPTVSYYADTVTMFVALPYYGATARPVPGSTNGAVMPTGVQCVMFIVKTVSRLMQNLSYSHTPLLKGSFALMEVSTRAFIGGNFAEGGIRYENQTTNATLSNGTVVSSIQKVTRVASICEAADPLLQHACLEIGEDIIATCTAPCLLPFHVSNTKNSFGSSLVHSHSLLYITEVRDDCVSLNLRLVAVTDLNAVMEELENSLLVAVATDVGVVVVLLIAACLIAYRSLAPLHTIEEKMLEASKTVRESNDLGQASAAAIVDALVLIDSHTSTESAFSEVDKVLSSFELLAVDLRGICAFLPNEGSSQDATSSPREDSVAISQLMHPQLDESPIVSAATSADFLNALAKPKLSSLNSEAKNITVVFLNFPRTHLVVDMKDAARRLDGLIAAVLRCAGRSRGVVESFFGDQFMVSFNASRKATTHPLQAAYFLECLHDEMMAAGELSLPEDPRTAPLYSPMVYAGVCTGSAVVRQVGAATLLRTQVVGHVVAQASSLMRLAKSRETSVLLSDAVISALHGVQFHTPSIESNTIRSVRTMIPRLYLHHAALVRVAFRSTYMLTASLFRTPPPAVAVAHRSAQAGLHARFREPSPAVVDPKSCCDVLLCRSALPLTFTLQGVADANKAMEMYQTGNVAEARDIARRCSEEHPLLLTRFFFMTGVLKSGSVEESVARARN